MQRLRIVPDESHDRTIAPLRIYVLGSPRVVFGDEYVLVRGRPKLLPLLALLALHAADPMARDRVATMLWPDASDAAARGNLRRHLLYLESSLPRLDEGTWLARSSTHVGWAAGRSIWIDAVAFVEAGLNDDRLREAVELYRGDFLPGVDDEWANAERERLRERHVYNLERLVEIERRTRNIGAALSYNAAALRYDPYREDLMRTSMRLRMENGDRAGALRDYERFVQMLHTELGAEPAAATKQLSAAVAHHEPVSSEPRALPHEYTTFIGRAGERRLLATLIETNRIVSIVGPPGIGKTRLAVHTAREVAARFHDGARFIDCAPAADADALVHAIALGCDERGRPRAETQAPIDEWLRHKHLLLVLDNAEHLAAECAQVAMRIARAAPHVAIVVTSRIVLDAPGEAVLRLEPLAAAEGLELFVDRARLARPDFDERVLGADAARTIVHATDGLPLALELAAGRLRSLTLADIVSRLRRPLRFLGDEPDRRDAAVRTLRASLDASYALLAADERRLFRRLAVFAAGATVEAAREICWTTADDWTVLRSLSRLVDHSLVVAPRVDAPEQRYELLQSIAEFARDRLEAEDDVAAVRRAHATAFADRYVALNDDLRGPRAHLHFDAVERDHDDLRLGLDLLLNEGADPALGARLALALSRFWFDRGLVNEGARWLEAALRRPLTPALRASVLHCIATLIRNQGNYQRAFALFGEALTLVRVTGDDAAIGKALATSSNAARMVGEHDIAIAHAAEAYASFVRTGDAYLCGYALMTSGCAAFAQGDLTAARTAFDAALTQYRLTDAEPDIALALGNIALCAYYEHDDVTAAILAAESAQRAEVLGNHYFRASALLTSARIALRRDDRNTACPHLHEVFRLAAMIDDKDLLVSTVELAVRHLIRDDPELAATLLGAADTARADYSVPRTVVEQAEHDELARELKVRLDPGIAPAIRRAGQRLSLAEAVVRAKASVGRQ